VNRNSFQYLLNVVHIVSFMRYALFLLYATRRLEKHKKTLLNQSKQFLFFYTFFFYTFFILYK